MAFSKYRVRAGEGDLSGCRSPQTNAGSGSTPEMAGDPIAMATIPPAEFAQLTKSAERNLLRTLGKLDAFGLL